MCESAPPVIAGTQGQRLRTWVQRYLSKCIGFPSLGLSHASRSLVAGLAGLATCSLQRASRSGRLTRYLPTKLYGIVVGQACRCKNKHTGKVDRVRVRSTARYREGVRSHLTLGRAVVVTRREPSWKGEGFFLDGPPRSRWQRPP